MITQEKVNYLKALNDYINVLKEVKDKYGLSQVQKEDYKRVKKDLDNLIKSL